MTDTPPQFAARGQVASNLVVGDAQITVTADALEVTTSTGAATWPYPDVLGMALANYAVSVRTTSGDVVVSRLGHDTEPFYQHLLTAYDDKVRRALFVTSAPVVRAKGHYSYDEAGQVITGTAPIEVHDDAVLVLPPDLNARRIPLCLVESVESHDYQLAITLTTGERYIFARLGYETEPVERAIAEGRQRMHGAAVANVRELDATLRPDQATALARLLLAGLAAPVGRLAQIAPSFVTALETRLATTRAAETYQTFRDLCDPDQICIGFTKVDPRATSDAPSDDPADPADDPASSPDPAAVLAGLGGLSGLASAAGLSDVGGLASDGSDDTKDADPYRLWLIAPSRSDGMTAVEFAGRGTDAAATFVYRHDGPGAQFATTLNRALEAVAFAREPIRLDEAELADPRYAKYRMAVQRNTSLQTVRQCLVARVVHRTTWHDTITGYFT
ncbi:MAG: hypothetical protein FWD11_06150 [Micrococcales bacterium]|nr:hypothetical protein [Micrococcales bacterium]